MLLKLLLESGVPVREFLFGALASTALREDEGGTAASAALGALACLDDLAAAAQERPELAGPLGRGLLRAYRGAKGPAGVRPSLPSCCLAMHLASLPSPPDGRRDWVLDAMGAVRVAARALRVNVVAEPPPDARVLTMLWSTMSGCVQGGMDWEGLLKGADEDDDGCGLLCRRALEVLMDFATAALGSTAPLVSFLNGLVCKVKRKSVIAAPNNCLPPCQGWDTCEVTRTAISIAVSAVKHLASVASAGQQDGSLDGGDSDSGSTLLNILAHLEILVEEGVRSERNSNRPNSSGKETQPESSGREQEGHAAVLGAEELQWVSATLANAGLELLSAGLCPLASRVLGLAAKASVHKVDLLRETVHGGPLPAVNDVRTLLDKRFKAHVTSVAREGRHAEACEVAFGYVLFGFEVRESASQVAVKDDSTIHS